jgi:putative transposase
VFGDVKFKQQIELQMGRRVSPIPKGGDRKSKKYLESKN